MRISDWSSDVCSSDLQVREERLDQDLLAREVVEQAALGDAGGVGDRLDRGAADPGLGHDPGRAVDKAAADEFRLLLALMRSEEHTSELQSLMRISYAVFSLKKKKIDNIISHHRPLHVYQNATTTNK